MAKKKDTEKKPLDIFQALAEQTNGEVLGQMKAAKYFIDTGNLAFNFIASGKFVDGGLPGGRISEFYGPSSSAKSLWATNLLFGCQKLGGYAILLDCENASNPEWIRKASHLDVDKVIRYTPKTLEEAFLKMYNVIKFIRKHDADVPIMIVYDSITVSPTARALKELDLPDNYTDADFKRIVQRHEQPGERAKVISTELMKLNGLMEEMDATILIINQVRQAIGVMYGCHSGNSKVLLADGTWRRIKQIVNGKEPVEVMSYNSVSGEVEPKRVTGWHDNGILKDNESFLKIRFRRYFGRGIGVLRITPNHVVFQDQTNGETKEVQAGTIRVGDKLSIVQPFVLNDDQMQVVYGSILGDGGLRRAHSEDGSPQLRLIQGHKQEDYLKFKVDMLDNVIATTGGTKPHNKGNAFYSDTRPLYELSELISYKDDYMIPAEIADNLNELGLAIWYLDDGNYSGYHEKWGSGKSVIYCVKFRNRETMLPAFARMGLYPKLTERGFVFDASDTLKLHQLICRFVPECMQYKLNPRFRNLFGFDREPIKPVEYRRIAGEVLDISHYNHPSQRRKYDLTIEDNATYVVGGAIVHNSPEVTSGGKALEFYCSQRFRTSAHKQITNPKLGKMVTGVNVKITNKKNRFFRPHAYAEGIQLLFDRGINPLSGLLEVLIQAERIVKVGTGRYAVMPAFRPEGSDETYEFTSSATRGDVPRKLVLDCPKIIDAKTRDEVEAYLAPYANFEQLEAEGSIVEEDLSDMLENEINND